METLFENTYVRTKETWKEFYLYFLYRKPIDQFFTIFAIAATLFFIPIAILMSPKYWIFVALLVGVKLISLLIYRMMISRAVRRDQEVYGEEASLTVTVTEDHIQLDDNSGRSSLDFSNFKTIAQTKHYYLLITKAKLCVIIDKRGFTLGNGYTFEKFLEQKGYKIH